jgi:hypothetical protein
MYPRCSTSLKEFAKRHPEMTFVHAEPGGVRTNLINHAESLWMRVLSPLAYVFAYPITVSKEDSADYLFAGLLRSPKGGSMIGRHGQDLGKVKYSEDVRQKVWEHSIRETGSA